MGKIIWIYETPDRGRTVYRRPFGENGPRELIRINNMPVKPTIWN